MNRPRLLAAACLAIATLHAAAADTRAACKLSPASGDVRSQAADAMSASLDAAQPAALANWDVRWWNKHRVWITLSLENHADATAHVLPQMLLDTRADGTAATVVAGPPLTLAPRARASDRLSIYVPDDARSLGVRLVGATLAGSVSATFALECSEARYDVGQRAPAVAPLMDEALRTYFNGAVDPLSDPNATFEAARRLGSGAQDSGDVAWMLRALMQHAHDTHGYVAAPGESPPSRRVVSTRAPDVALLPDGTAMLRLHGLDTRVDADALAWATRLHDDVRATAARHPRAWIVDLRDHDADSPWPAFAALSALLDGPVIGSFETRAGSQPWIADRGVSRVAGGPALVDVQAAPEPPFRGPVAVLVGPGTRNAGEDLALAFRGRARTRFFGSPTAGFPSAGVVAHTLSDGSVLGVLEARAADRTGVVQRTAIEPDARVDEAERDAPLPAVAQDWLRDATSP